MLLNEANIPLGDVRLLRHKDQRAAKGRTPYELWRDDRPSFEHYQNTQAIKNRKKLLAPYWASFVGTPGDETLFVGFYSVRYFGLLKKDKPKPHMDGVDEAGSCDSYCLTLDSRFAEFDGKLLVDWGEGKRSWIQRADRQSKRIVELRTEFKEPAFPGFLNFVECLSRLEQLPVGWKTTLKSCRGNLLAHLSSHQRAICRQGRWWRWFLGSLANLRSYWPWGQCRTKKPGSV
jgi:hypothetical protein